MGHSSKRYIFHAQLNYWAPQQSAGFDGLIPGKHIFNMHPACQTPLPTGGVVGLRKKQKQKKSERCLYWLYATLCPLQQFVVYLVIVRPMMIIIKEQL